MKLSLCGEKVSPLSHLGKAFLGAIMKTIVRAGGLAGCLVLGLIVSLPRADAGEGGKPVAKVQNVFGGLFCKDGLTWRALKSGQDIPDGKLLVSLPKAELVSSNGAVHIAMLADIGQRGPYPVLESAAKIHSAKDCDLDLTFDRGLIILTNRKKAGETKVRLHARGETWILTLQTPDTSVAMEIFSRHAPGMPKLKGDKVAEPSTDLLMLVLVGRAFLDAGAEGIGLKAPPGPARFHWSSVDKKHSVLRLEKLPAEVVMPFADEQAKAFKDICLGTEKLMGGKVIVGIGELVRSNNTADRLVGITWAGALDDLPHVLAALADEKHADSREHAIVVLRHWLGRGSGQVKALLQTLAERKKLPAARAQTTLHLLFGFDQHERERPETYQLLIHCLDHSALPVRELAHWHLVRLAPAGKDIGFDAAAPEAQRHAAVGRWQALIPEGQLPPEPKTSGKGESR